MPVDRLRVFAVEETSAQICWAALPVGDVRVSAGDHSVVVASDGQPGGADIDGLSPRTRYVLEVDGRPALRFATLAPPPGRLLCKFATVSDLHIGEQRFGGVFRMRESRPWPDGEPYSLRCARAALTDALAWGAEAIVVKGDLTQFSRTDQFAVAGRLLADLPVPVETIPGNHDQWGWGADMWDAMADVGIIMKREPWCRDLPGVRLIMGLSALPVHKWGEVDDEQRAALVALAAEAPGAAFVALHHYPQRFSRPNVYPPGISGRQAGPLLDELAAANPAVFLSSGHTHRNRRHYHRSVVVTEVGSTKDYPGVWAGYAVHEGGIRQVVRRIVRPDCIAWTERTRWALAGIWGEWSPGPRSHRCFTRAW